MNKPHKVIANIGQLALAFSILVLALSIAYFASVIAKTQDNIPQILEKTQVASKSINAAALQVKDIIPHVPQILEETRLVRESVKSVVEESAMIRAQVQEIAVEISEVRKVIPTMINESIAIREAVPPILKEVQTSRALVNQYLPEILTESQAVRNTILAVVSESQAVREGLPLTLDRLDQIMQEASKTGRKAGEGAISGIFTGIIKAPYAVVKNVGASFFGEKKVLTSSDFLLLRQSVSEILSANEFNQQKAFNNSKTGLSGFVMLLSEEKQATALCRQVRIKIDAIDDAVKQFCKGHNKEAQWELSSSP